MVKKCAMQVMGINVQPLLAVGGVSGIAIGFGAQSVSANAITGINLVGCRSTRGLRREKGGGGGPVWLFSDLPYSPACQQHAAMQVMP